MDFTVLIPARLASTRLPRKPLADIAGLPMVVHVARRAAISGATTVVVAADSAEIVEACASHGVRAMLTRDDHPTGSDRLAEACERLGLDGEDIVVNVQGDEPLIEPALINACANLLNGHRDCVMSTAAHHIDELNEFLDPNVVKVVCDSAGRALYFSRAPIAWQRDGGSASHPVMPDPLPLRHIGIYAYHAGYLRRFCSLPQSPLERCESLEQLRVLWHGDSIAVHLSSTRPGPGVDTAEDLARVRELLTRQA